MSKAFVDDLIHSMKLADFVSKVTPWSVEGFGDKAFNVRYLGIKLTPEWREIFSDKNNLLLKFVVDRTTSRVELYLANKPPFVKIISRDFNDGDKWEIILGEIKKRLRRDKIDAINHNAKINNLYERIQKDLKK